MNPPMLLGLALTLSAPALKDRPRKVDLTGEWVVESMTSAGRVRPPRAGPLRYVFTADGKWFTYRGERLPGAPERAYYTNPKADPPTLDLVYEPDEQDGRVGRAIFRMDGDKLTLCVARRGQPRPTAFESTADAPNTLYVFRRVRPGD